MTRTFTIYVTPPSGAEQLVGTNYAFRTEQQSVTSLNTLNIYASTGSATVSNPKTSL
jgi:hypothetical protein